ncbi:hypothetical protein XENOCAPTIV_015572 [Xenoophorus captivus]|uniref:Uncharacterized protein n=1 Tax=Xenoophorus captivus TaxID=1517983 RepID=A0ABV0RQW0_9TELE
MRVCAAGGVMAAGYPAVRGRVPIHLPRHRSDVFNVPAALNAVLCVDVVQSTAACVSGLVCVTLHVSLGVDSSASMHVVESDATLMCVCKHTAASIVSMAAWLERPSSDSPFTAISWSFILSRPDLFPSQPEIFTRPFCLNAIRLSSCQKTTSKGAFGSCCCLAVLIPDQPFISNSTLASVPCCHAEQIWEQRRGVQEKF